MRQACAGQSFAHARWANLPRDTTRTSFGIIPSRRARRAEPAPNTPKRQQPTTCAGPSGRSILSSSSTSQRVL